MREISRCKSRGGGGKDKGDKPGQEERVEALVFEIGNEEEGVERDLPDVNDVVNGLNATEDKTEILSGGRETLSNARGSCRGGSSRRIGAAASASRSTEEEGRGEVAIREINAKSLTIEGGDVRGVRRTVVGGSDQTERHQGVWLGPGGGSSADNGVDELTDEIIQGVGARDERYPNLPKRRGGRVFDGVPETELANIFEEAAVPRTRREPQRPTAMADITEHEDSLRDDRDEPSAHVDASPNREEHMGAEASAAFGFSAAVAAPATATAAASSGRRVTNTPSASLARVAGASQLGVMNAEFEEPGGRRVGGNAAQSIGSNGGEGASTS